MDFKFINWHMQIKCQDIFDAPPKLSFVPWARSEANLVCFYDMALQWLFTTMTNFFSFLFFFQKVIVCFGYLLNSSHDLRTSDLMTGCSSLIQIADGLVLEKTSSPLGVLLVIFESRPDALVQVNGVQVFSLFCIVNLSRRWIIAVLVV